MNRYTSVLFLILFIVSVSAEAQDFNSYKQQQQKAFQSYKQKSQEDWDTYRRKANDEFAKYLEQAWVKKTGQEPIEKPKDVPDVPPVVLPEIDIDIPEDAPIDVDINLPALEDKPIIVPPIQYKPKPTEKSISFTFYGTSGHVRFDVNKKVSLAGSDEKSVARFWKELSGKEYDNIVADCQNIHYDRDLCDWAYLKMTEKVAETIYGSGNERTVFHAWLLSQSGFRIKLGRENGNIHLLVGTPTALFEKLFWKMDDGYYSLLDDSQITSLHIMDAEFPNTSLLRMRMNVRNDFEKNGTPSRKLNSKRYAEASADIVCDKNSLAFLADMPVPAISETNHADYLMFAYMPLSDKASSGLYSGLLNQIMGKSELEGANILLNFVQTAFEYKTDTEAWGKERVFFPEETLFYPYCDCEDRAILFCYLVQNLMGLDVAFVSYPGHLAAAVNFNEKVSGDYFLVSGKKYVVCDPTFINAPVGRTMPGMDNNTAEVFLMDK